jgi:hypothetical protein
MGAQTSGLCGVDDARFDNLPYMVNSTGDYSGVPLGGVGVGYFDFAPDGEIKRVAINNPHQDGVLTDTKNGTFFAVWDAASSAATVMHRAPAGGAAGEAGLGCLAEHSTNFSGLFPFATLAVDTLAASVRAWSGLVPQDIENSSLPLVHIEVTLTNSGVTPKRMAAAMSWQDVISRSIFDASDDQLAKFYPKNKGQATCALDVNELMSDLNEVPCTLNGRTHCRDMHRASTLASPLHVGSLLHGIEQHTADRTLVPNKLTMQQYNSRVALMVESEQSDDYISMVKAYSAVGDADGVAAWEAFQVRDFVQSPIVLSLALNHVVFPPYRKTVPFRAITTRMRTHKLCTSRRLLVMLRKWPLRWHSRRRFLPRAVVRSGLFLRGMRQSFRVRASQTTKRFVGPQTSIGCFTTGLTRRLGSKKCSVSQPHQRHALRSRRVRIPGSNLFFRALCQTG